MAANFPGPWELRFNYTTVSSGITTRSQLRHSCDVDTPPAAGSPLADYDLKSRAGLFWTAESWASALVTDLVALYETTASFIDVELWKYNTGTFNADFQSSGALGAVGLSGATTNEAGVGIMTFRSQNGGSARLTLVQLVLPDGPTDGWPFTVAEVTALGNRVTNQNSPMIARDNGYLFSPLNWLVGQNEELWKKYNR